MLVEWPAEGHLHLIRHAEARKNVEDRRGGGGTELTSRGVDQARRIGAYVSEYETGLGHGLTIYGHSVPHVQQTAALISSPSGWHCRVDEDLRGIDLGRIDGLTTQEARQIDPAAVERLYAWQLGRLRVDKVQLPEAEPIQQFTGRVVNALRRIVSNCTDTCTVIVGTQSTLILIINLLELGKAFDFSRYCHHSFSNGFISRWRMSSGFRVEDERLVVPAAAQVSTRGRSSTSPASHRRAESR